MVRIKEVFGGIVARDSEYQRVLGVMEDQLPEVRRRVASILLPNVRRCRDPLTILRGGIKHPDCEIRRLAAEVMAQFGDAVVPDLITALGDSEPAVVCQAASALRNINGYAVLAVTPLSRLLGHRNTVVRRAAALALVEFRPQCSALGQRMGADLSAVYKQLHVFRRIGMLLLANGLESSYSALSERMYKTFGETYNATTIRNYIRTIAELFDQYRIISGMRATLPSGGDDYDGDGPGLFQSEQGRPFRIRALGWECWGETMLYFALNEGRIDDLPQVISAELC